MMRRIGISIFIIVLSFVAISSFSQPFTDIASFNYQTFSTSYNSNPVWKNKTDDYFLNLFLPKQFKNGNVLLARVNSEKVNATIFRGDSSYSSGLYQLSLPLGFQFVSSNKKWKTIVIGIPKISASTNRAIDRHDYQLGGIFLENYTFSDNLKIKAGLYYNREAFGNFFMPLAGLDWNVTDRFRFYGVIPSNYRAEYMLKRNRLYTGLGLKSYTRSFRLSQAMGYDYVRYNEIQLKWFLEYFVYKKILLTAEVGYLLGRTPLQYAYGTKIKTDVNPIYTPGNRCVMFNVGVAYRLRFDLQQ